MRFIAALCSLVAVSMAQATPHVVGFERFHSARPSAEGGAILFSELGCANCHGGSAVVVPRSGPSLNELSSRVHREWVVEFLKDPQSGREGSTMPQMSHGLSDIELQSVVDYLGTLGKDLNLPSSRHVNAERGSALYHEKGCVSCHAPTPDFRGSHGSGEDFKSDLAVPLHDLKKKTNLMALDHFLSNPARYRTDGRMPHIQLAKEESIDVAAHLLDFQSSDGREAKPPQKWPIVKDAQIEKGKAIVAEMNCIACHAIPGEQEIQLVALSGSPNTEIGHCLSASPTKGLPHYDLSETQRKSLIAFLESEAPGKDTDGKLTFAAMNCYACHDRNGTGGPLSDTDPFFVGDESLGDSGRLPPPLTGIGHKLQRDWLEGVFAGKPENRVRPYLKTRMPAYAKHSKFLADWISTIDANPKSVPITVDPDDIESGRQLLGTHGGVNCITCHNWGEQPSLGIPGLDISSLDHRLRSSWFREYLINPASYRPGTLMPPLWPGRKSSIPDVLNGDTDRQIAAIWGFIKSGIGKPEGFPDRSGGQFELIPQDRPIIQRTFLEKTGTKAILVGFPGEIHIAYDGFKAQPSLVWRGKFFDAYNTWFTRAAPFEKPLSEDVYEFESSSGESRFRGYRMDKSGNPTFLVSRNGQHIDDSFLVRDATLVRTISWKNGNTPMVTHPKGVEMKQVAGDKTLTFTYSWK